MVKNIVLFGASKLGMLAYHILKDSYNILYYCDNDSEKWGKRVSGVEVISPTQLKKLTNIDVIITSSYYCEIGDQLQNLGIFSYKSFKYCIEDVRTSLVNSARKKFDISIIDLGEFLSSLEREISIDDITFMTGGSSLLDYVLLKAIMIKFNFKTYMEIGTWMGESIAAVSGVADRCYSISLPDDDKNLINYFKRINNKNNFSRYFSNKKNNIFHYYEDSKTFDFKIIPDKIDLVFIDGDHSYEGIKSDTKKIFDIIDKNNAIVVWHDFKEIRNNYILSTVQAIYDALPEKLHNNIFAVDRNFCGIYIPDKYISKFNTSSNPNIMYSYEATIKSKFNELIMTNEK